MGELQVWCCRQVSKQHFSTPEKRESLLSIHRWRWEPCRCGSADRCQSSTSQHLGSGSHYCLSIDGDGSLAGVVLQTGVKAALLNTWAAGVIAVYPKMEMGALQVWCCRQVS